MNPHHIVIIGGGISGLSAAYFLLQKDPTLRVTVLEAGAYWGGKIRTERVDGFVIEGGPDCFLAAKPQAVALCRELGLEENLQGTRTEDHSTYIMHKNQLQPIPAGLVSMVPTDFKAMASTRLLSWPQKARMALDLVIPPRPAASDESVGAFVSRRLGRGAYDNLIQPLIAGIYTGDGDALSISATFPALREMEQQHGGLIRGALARRKQSLASGESNAHSRATFLTPKNGLAALPEALVATLRQKGADLRLNTYVSHLSPLPNAQFIIHIENESPLKADAVIVAAPAHASAALLASLDPQLSSYLMDIPLASTATVSLAYPLADLPRALRGYGYVIPRREQRAALACTWTSSKFEGRAPTSHALLRVFLGRAGETLPASDTDLLMLAREELATTLHIRTAPVLTRIFRWEKAMPQYNLGHAERMARIENAAQKHPRLALAGNIYKGVGIPDCIYSGELAAQKLITSL